VWDGREDSDAVVGSLVPSILFLPLWGIFSYFSLSVGVCYKAGVWMDSAAVDLLHSVRINKNSWCEVL
jgi:hypothetical protein